MESGPRVAFMGNKREVGLILELTTAVRVNLGVQTPSRGIFFLWQKTHSF